jgi:hypothetical protein
MVIELPLLRRGSSIFSLGWTCILNHFLNVSHFHVCFWWGHIGSYGFELLLINIWGSCWLGIWRDDSWVSSTWKCHLTSLKHLNSSKPSINNWSILYHRRISIHSRNHLLIDHLLDHHLLHLNLVISLFLLLSDATEMLEVSQLAPLHSSTVKCINLLLKSVIG